MPMKVTILGTANAWGVNPLLNPAPRCPMRGTLLTGQDVEIRKYRTSLLVEGTQGERILVDCSPDFGHQLREFGLTKVDAVCITHPHLDHIGGLDELNLLKNAASNWTPIPVWATEECWQTIRKYGFDYIVTQIELVTENTIREPSFCVGNITITPFPVDHSSRIAPGAVGFLFEEQDGEGLKRILYTGDLWRFGKPEQSIFSRPVDVAIVECDRWAGLPGAKVGGGHMSFEGILDLLKNGVLSRCSPSQLVLVHFGDNGPNGSASNYKDWRENALAGLREHDLMQVVSNEEHVIGYEGLKLG
jgi:phosphoribosyl 1,2-cyclic phosphodiesterase